jgi:hypothetical protein
LTRFTRRDKATEVSDTISPGAASADTSYPPGRRIALVVAGVLTMLAPFVGILCLGVPSWFPAAATLDTVTIVRPGAPWSDPSWSLAGRLLWSLLLASSFVTLLHLRGWCGRWLPPALLLAGLAVSQAAIWATGQSKFGMIGGLIPFSDASGYFDYANQMLENHRIVSGFTDRSMFSALLSSILQFVGPNLKTVLALLLFSSGVGMFLATREMRARFGSVAAVCFLFVVHAFYNRTIGMLMTEHLGLALGLFSFALLLRGVMEPRRAAWFVGMLLLSAALCARAGAFFVLPPLCLVTGRLFRKSGRFSVRMFALAIAVMLLPFVLNRMLLVQLFDPATRPKSNFSYAAYGVLRGTNWTDALNTFGTDHEKIRTATLEILRKKPYTVLHAVRRTWRGFFWDSTGFIFMGPEWSRVLLYAFLFGIALGIARASRTPYDGFSAAIGGGILASIPFVPPIDCDLMRAYAATMPLHACLAAGALGALVRLVAPAFRRKLPDPGRLVETQTLPDNSPVIATVSGALILFLTFVLPLGRSLLTPAVAECPDLTGRKPSDSVRGTAIHLVADDAPRPFVPNVRISDFRQRLGGLEGYIFKKEAAWLASLPAGTSIVAGSINEITVIATEKLYHPTIRAEFDKFSVASLHLAVDRELSLPISPDATAPPTGEKPLPE